jgi:hypothetical protein
VYPSLVFGRLRFGLLTSASTVGAVLRADAVLVGGL